MANFDLVSYKLDGEEIVLTKDVVKKYLCKDKDISDDEFYLFASLCKARGINPFLKEAYIVKYGQNAQIFPGKDFFMKRAAMNPKFDGIEDGVIAISPKGEVTYLDGTFVPDGFSLAGGWAKVYVKGISKPKCVTLSLKEYAKKDKDGNALSNWKDMPAVMINKCAKVSALREAFPLDFNGLYIEEEFNGRDDPIVQQTPANDDAINVDAKVVNNEPADEMQIKKIQQLVGSNVELAQELRKTYGFTHLRDLTVSKASEIIKALKK